MQACPFQLEGRGMESWQVDVIRSNLTKLGEMSEWDKTFLASLSAHHLLSDEQINEIESMESGRLRAEYLFERLTRREKDDAYGLLIEACKQSAQSELVAILENGELEHNLATRNTADSKGRTGFHRALLSRASLDSLQKFIAIGADVQMKDDKKEGALHFAVRGGNTQLISYLISLKLDINEADELGQTPLHKVIFSKSGDYLGLTRELLDVGADLCAKESYGDTLAHLFAIAQDISSEDFENWVKGMVDIGHGHIFGVRGYCGRMPVQAAVQNRELDPNTIKMLVDLTEMDINEKDEDGVTLLELALLYGRSLRLIESLIQMGADIGVKSGNGSGVLHAAVIGGNMEAIQDLIGRGFDVNERNDLGDSPLQCVKETRLNNYFQMTKFLVENGADLYSKNNKGNTLAHQLPLWRDVNCEDFASWVAAMIENGYAQLFAIRGELGRTPFTYSIERLDFNLETIKLMIEAAKLDINQLDDEGNTALDLALAFGRNLDTIKALVELGADWKKRGVNGCTVLHSAVLEGNQQAFLYFKSLGADVNGRDDKAQTPLHYVRWSEGGDYLGMTTFLLENGADVDTRDVLGRPLDELMSDWLSDEEYAVWKDGMIGLGHEDLFD